MPLPATATDVELVAAVRGGHEEAIILLVERYSPRVYHYLVGLVGEEALAEDIMQDTWLRVVERLDRYDSSQPFVTWLFAVARHRAIDTLRQRTRLWKSLGRSAEAQQNEEGEPLDPIEQVEAVDPSAFDQLAAAELKQRVTTAFSRLPLHYREVLTLRFHQDLRLEEIARLLVLPLSTVKTRLQRGLVLLRQRAQALGLNTQ